MGRVSRAFLAQKQAEVRRRILRFPPKRGYGPPRTDPDEILRT